MPDKRLLAIVTVLMMMGNNAQAQQVLSIEELRQIEALIAQKDCGALYTYLATNPKMTVGDDPLAIELRSFRQDVDRGRLDCFPRQTTMAFRDDPTQAGQRAFAANANIY